MECLAEGAPPVQYTSTEYKLLSFLGFEEEDKSSTATFNFSIFNNRRGGHTTSLATSELPSVQQ